MAGTTAADAVVAEMVAKVEAVVMAARVAEAVMAMAAVAMPRITRIGAELRECRDAISAMVHWDDQLPMNRLRVE